jgi:tetratricopeptide (TPR) repeat protein
LQKKEKRSLQKGRFSKKETPSKKGESFKVVGRNTSVEAKRKMDEQNVLDFFAEDFALFIEAGFIAVKQLDEIASRRLFKAAETLNPNNPASQLGLGYIALNKLHVSEAISIFEAIVKKDSEHHLAKTLLGVAYLLTQDRRKKGEQLILEVKEKTDDPTIKNLADVSLEWLKKDLGQKNLPPLKASV